MRVRALDSNDDWTFGRGGANYIGEKQSLNQKVKTRIKSFKNDNPLNMDDNIDWLDLLGRRGTEDTILKEIERVTLQTNGVTEVTSIEVTKRQDRVESILLEYGTIYDEPNTIEILEL